MAISFRLATLGMINCLADSLSTRRLKDHIGKPFVFLAVVLAAVCSSFAESTNDLERFSPDLSNTTILWQAPTNGLPKSLWTYRRLPPQPFLMSVISNAVVLAGMQGRGFPEPSTNTFDVVSNPNPVGIQPVNFSIQPISTTIYFYSPNQDHSTNNIPEDEAVKRRAFECAALFGLTKTFLVPSDIYTRLNTEFGDSLPTSGVCARGIHLSRKLDGVSFFTLGKSTDFTEGFSIELGSGGQIRLFSLVWPNLERNQNGPTANPEEIIRCIRARRILVLPGDEETDYFDRVKGLAGAKTFTITKITPFYSEGVFGQMPTYSEVPQTIAPFAELEAVANFGASKMAVRLLSPILASDVVRLTTKEDK